jgi:hypothetical protein
VAKSKVRSVKELSITKEKAKNGVFFKEDRKHGKELEVPLFAVKNKNALLKAFAEIISSSQHLENIYAYIVKIQETNRVGIITSNIRLFYKE